MIICLLIIVPIISIILYLVKEHKKWGLDIGDYLASLIAGCISFIITLLLILLIYGIFEITAISKYELKSTQKIYCLNDNTTINGKIYLFSDYVDENDVYKMYVDNDGGKSLLKVNANNSIIYEDNKTEIQTYECKFQNKYVVFILGEVTLFSPNKYKIHIPKGSITTEYNVDLK